MMRTFADKKKRWWAISVVIQVDWIVGDLWGDLHPGARRSQGQKGYIPVRLWLAGYCMAWGC
jgi:hypothetical protein